MSFPSTVSERHSASVTNKQICFTYANGNLVVLLNRSYSSPRPSQVPGLSTQIGKVRTTTNLPRERVRALSRG